MHRVDRAVVDLFQWLYDELLDRFGVTIGTFRMSIALFPVGIDTLAKAVRGFPVPYVMMEGVFVVGIGLFYNFRMMRSDDKLQVRRKFKSINARSLHFRRRFFQLRIFYLAFFASSAVFHHNVAGLGMLAIVYARCLLVRSRKEPERRQAVAYLPA